MNRGTCRGAGRVVGRAAGRRARRCVGRDMCILSASSTEVSDRIPPPNAGVRARVKGRVRVRVRGRVRVDVSL